MKKAEQGQPLRTRRRKLLSGHMVKEDERGRQHLVIHTECPGKWAFVDLQHGNIWLAHKGREGDWDEWRVAGVSDLHEIWLALQKMLEIEFNRDIRIRAAHADKMRSAR